MKNKNSQLVKIASHLMKGKSVTPIQALNNWGCFRLSARILDLKNRGMRIKTETKVNRNNGKSFASYSIAK